MRKPTRLSALPQGVGEEWMSTNLWKSAESIEGVRVMRDVEEYEARLFGARTLGHVVRRSGCAVAVNLKGISIKRVEELNRRRR
jgi:hypothetical protein